MAIDTIVPRKYVLRAQSSQRQITDAEGNVTLSREDLDWTRLTCQIDVWSIHVFAEAKKR